MTRKVVQHPGVESSPLMTLAEAIGIAEAGEMEDVCVMYSDKAGNMHIAWSKQTNTDLAANAVVLSNIAACRLMEEA